MVIVLHSGYTHAYHSIQTQTIGYDELIFVPGPKNLLYASVLITDLFVRLISQGRYNLKILVCTCSSCMRHRSTRYDNALV